MKWLLALSLSACAIDPAAMRACNDFALTVGASPLEVFCTTVESGERYYCQSIPDRNLPRPLRRAYFGTVRYRKRRP